MRTLGKRFAILAAVALALAGCTMTTTAGGGGSTEPRHITTTGEAEVRVTPDQVVITVGVETADPAFDTAKVNNDAIVSKVMDAAHKNGVADAQIQTEFLSARPPGYYSSSNKDFHVDRTIAITLSDLSKFETLIADLAGTGLTNVFSIDFRTTELRKYRDQARSMAITAAREKATALSGELSERVGQPLEIQENYSRSYSWYGYGWYGSSLPQSQNVSVNAGSSQLTEGSLTAPRQISVTAQVTVTFELQ